MLANRLAALMVVSLASLLGGIGPSPTERMPSRSRTIWPSDQLGNISICKSRARDAIRSWPGLTHRSEEHTSELQSPCNLVCRLLLEKKKKHSDLIVFFLYY